MIGRRGDGQAIRQVLSPTLDLDPKCAAAGVGVEVVIRRQRLSALRNEIDALLATRNGTWQQVNNAERRWGQLLVEPGLNWARRRRSGPMPG